MEGGNGKRRPSPAEINEALRGRIAGPCPMCAGASWEAPANAFTFLPVETDKDRFDVKVSDEGEGRFSTKGMVALPLVCQDCGFIAQMSYDVLFPDH